MRSPALITLTLMLASSLANAAGIYSWKDASGKTIYSDKPPLEKKVTARELGTGKTVAPATVAPAEAAKAAAQNGASGANKEPAKSPEQSKADIEARQQLCDNARKRLAQLEADKGILLTKNDKGDPVPLVGDARKVETDSARKDVEFWCR